MHDVTARHDTPLVKPLRHPLHVSELIGRLKYWKHSDANLRVFFDQAILYLEEYREALQD